VGFAAREWGNAGGTWLWSGRDELFFVPDMKMRQSAAGGTDKT